MKAPITTVFSCVNCNASAKLEYTTATGYCGGAGEKPNDWDVWGATVMCPDCVRKSSKTHKVTTAAEKLIDDILWARTMCDHSLEGDAMFRMSIKTKIYDFLRKLE